MRIPFRALALTAALAVTNPAPAGETYQVDPVHSSVIFRVKHMNTSYAWGRFNDLTGSFTLNPTDPSRDAFRFEVKTASVDTANEKRDQHLKSPDFFNAVQYPTITFKSKTVTRTGTFYEVEGDLTLHGVTKPVTVRVTPTGSGKDMTGNPIAGVEANFTVRQSDFGMNKTPGPLGDDVWVNVSVEGVNK